MAAEPEPETQRLRRNLDNLLQELRVEQTGVQLLTGFLLIVPFQQRFDALIESMRLVYLGTVVCSISATVLFVAPVAMHRLLFRRHRMHTVVVTAHRCAYTGLLLLGLALVGVTVIIFGFVAGPDTGLLAGAGALIALVGFWVVLPIVMRSVAGPRGR